MLVDLLLVDMGADMFYGQYGTSHGRSKATSIKSAAQESTINIAALVWGLGRFEGANRGSIALATNPDAMEETDNRRPSYWASHGRLPRTAQYENVLVALHHINRHPSPSIFEARHYAFTHTYFPKWAFDEVVEKDGWIFGRAGDGYIALYSDMTYEWQTEGPDAGQEVIALGNENAWIVQMGRAATDGSFEAFRQSISSAPLAVDGLSVEFDSPGNGLITFGWEEPFTVNGEVISLRDYPRFDNPYTRSAEFGTGFYLFEHGGQTLALDFQNTGRLVDGE